MSAESKSESQPVESPVFGPVPFTPIGVIHSGHRLADRTPVQPVYAHDCSGHVALLPQYLEGLRGLEGFSHIILLYHLHLAEPPQMIVQPFVGDHPCGVFATRHPRRPNPIGMSLVRLVKIEDGILHLLDVDILDGTPLLDIKPFVPRFDIAAAARGGWAETVDEDTARIRGQRGFKP
jgi:tRNA-Thr(GGU) m(6)t(6)A37 methyltransferase TsaA